MITSSISGIRGTIGGTEGESLTILDVVRFVAGYARFVKETYPNQEQATVLIGRDARTTGYTFSLAVTATLQSYGVSAIDLGLVPTPTLALAVARHEAVGGIMITASHNPIEYNGLKLLNHQGEFLNNEEGSRVLELAKEPVTSVQGNRYGGYAQDDYAIREHVQAILNLKHLDIEAIRKRRFTVAFDAVNSVGGIAVPRLLEALNVTYIPLHDEPNGQFAHLPEPLPANLTDLRQKVKETGADLGISVDPDVDRLVLVDEHGEFIGEEYSLVVAADAVLAHKLGPVVTNLSSSQALDELARKYSVSCHRCAVGEKNVVTKMKEVGAVVGGEGSGGIIYPPLHHGRDALIGIALVLDLLARRGSSLSELRASYQSFAMEKAKIELGNMNPAEVFKRIAEKYQNYEQNHEDGLWLKTGEHSWVHLRSSNTEPIIRIFSEAKTVEEAQQLVLTFTHELTQTI